MSSEVETSLNTSEIARDSSTPLGMTKTVRYKTRAVLRAFTIIELLVVITIIIILGSLILSTVGYVQKKGARSRAEAEMAAMSAALESYKADNGIYPSTPNTVSLTAMAAVDNGSVSGSYASATLDVYTLLTGDTTHDGTSAATKSYMTFKPQMLGRQSRSVPISSSNKITSISDPFGNSYGYSTSKNPDVNPNASSAAGFNPTYDLWTAADASPSPNQTQWIKNW